MYEELINEGGAWPMRERWRSRRLRKATQRVMTQKGKTILWTKDSVDPDVCFSLLTVLTLNRGSIWGLRSADSFWSERKHLHTFWSACKFPCVDRGLSIAGARYKVGCIFGVSCLKEIKMHTSVKFRKYLCSKQRVINLPPGPHECVVVQTLRDGSTVG